VNAAELSYVAGWRLVRHLPRPVTAPLFAAGADLAVRRGGAGVDRLSANLRRVVGPGPSDAEHADLVRRAMRSYTRYYLDAFRLPALSREQIRTEFCLVTRQLLADAIDAGQGVVLALPHSGNWDLAGAYVAANGWPLTTVAERLKPESLYRRFLAYRESLGMEILPLTGGDGSLRGALEDRLRKGAAVALLGDRDLPGRGVEVQFFGAPATMPPGPALLALRTGAPLYAVDLWYQPDGAYAEMHGPLEVPTTGPFGQRVRQLTQDLADRYAEGIARHPEDWHMLQRVWRDDVVSR
jgi:lauroyl/myristoyl acyltransferase